MNRPRRSTLVRVTSAASQRRPKPEPEPVLKIFSKIILRSTIDEKMMKIPPRFVRLGPKLSDNVTIETPVGVKHSIRIKRFGHEVWFENGWSEFAEAHSLSEGHFLFFHYKGNSSFLVVICNKSASEIDYPLNKVCVIESDDDGDGDQVMEVVDDDDDEVIDLDELLKKKKPIANIKPEKVSTITRSIVFVEDETNQV